MSTCIVDFTGHIIYVDDAWLDFAQMNRGEQVNLGIGANYLKACKGSKTAILVQNLIKQILERKETDFQVTYGCHAPWAARFFRLYGSQHPKGCKLHHKLIIELSEISQLQKKILELN